MLANFHEHPMYLRREKRENVLGMKKRAKHTFEVKGFIREVKGFIREVEKKGRDKKKGTRIAIGFMLTVN